MEKLTLPCGSISRITLTSTRNQIPCQITWRDLQSYKTPARPIKTVQYCQSNDARVSYLLSANPLTTANSSAWTQSRLGGLCPGRLFLPTTRARSGHRCTNSPMASGRQCVNAASRSGRYNSLGTLPSQDGDELWSLTTSLAHRSTKESTIVT